MSTQVTIVICAFIVGIVILGSQWINAVYKRKEVADANTLCRTTNQIFHLVGAWSKDYEGMRDNIKLTKDYALQIEKHLGKLVENAEVLKTRIDKMADNIATQNGGYYTDFNLKLDKLLDCGRHTNSLIETKGNKVVAETHDIFQLLGSLHISVNTEIDTINEFKVAMYNEMQGLHNEINDLDITASNIHSETASIDSRLNGYLGEQVKEKEQQQ